MKNQKEKIFDIALDLISEKGFDGIGIREIASKAGISTSLFYNYFKSKEDILFEIINKGMEDVFHSFQNNIEIELSDPIDIYIYQINQIIKENRKLWRVIHQVRLNKKYFNFKEEDDFTLKVKYSLSLLLNKSQNDPIIDVIFATVDGIISHYLLFDNYNLESSLEELIQLLKKIRD